MSSSVKPLVSVLMPAYNAQTYVSESIESILKQTFSNFELIILDDASTDQTYNIIKKFEEKDKRVKVYKNKKNLDIADSRNKLIDLSRGKYIAWQDADDISSLDRLMLQVNYLELHKSVGIVGGYLQFFSDHKNEGIRKYQEKDDEIRKNIFFFSPVAQPVAMIRRVALVGVGKYGKNLSPAEDIDMSFRIGKDWQFANIQKVLLNYRNHHYSSTHKRLKKIELVTIKTRLKYVFDNNYSFSLVSLLFNIFQFLSIFLIPDKIKIKLFNRIRNS